MEPKKLKLGLLLDSLEAPAWFYHSLERMINANCAEVAIVILKDRDMQDAAALSHNQGGAYGILYERLKKIDEALFRRQPDAFEPLNLEKLVAGVPAIRVRPIQEGNLDIFAPEDVKRVRNAQLDILVKVGFRQLGGEIAAAAKYGVWFYEHSDIQIKRGGPAGFWEAVESWPETGSTLLMACGPSQPARVIYRSRCLTYPFSPARNRSRLYWAASSFLPRQVAFLYHFGEERFFQETARFNGAFDFYDRSLYQVPTNLEMLRVSGALIWRNLVEIYQRKVSQETWYLMYTLSNASSLSFADFKVLFPPKDRFWADPQVIRRADTYFIFVEELIYKNHRGHISVIEMDGQGRCKEPVPVLETDYHLSYPFVFEHQGTCYMVPESSANNSIDLYECVEFPTKWKRKMTLMNNVKAVDTTLFFDSKKWWLFTGITENEGALPEVELFLFYSDDLFTDQWHSHPLNPVVSDVASARPAGRIFLQDGKLYRPSQDCSKNYGYGFNLNEIVRLSETEYLETKVAAVKPNWARRLIGTHTYTKAEGLQIIDGVTRRSKLF